ncbi:MAG: site-specific DNA-methyltransferase [Bacteroidales bacterium]|nr:site-specific DNA-methyltransferase [Bacteroidales bacterium]
MELKIEYLPIKALKPYEKNTRKHQKKDVDNIARSIEKYGMCDAIGIWGEQNIIVEGHGRMLACKQLGMTEVPCVRLDHLTDEQRREYAIAHNATAELSEWDLDILPDELAELDLSDFDFDFGIEDEEEETEIVEDEAPEVDEDAEPIAKLGDIWQLGRHRLMCGDSTDKATVETLMDGNKADMVFTDPPYGIDVVQGNKVGGGGATHFGKVGGGNIVQASTYMAIKGDDTTDTARFNYEIVKELSENQIIFGGNYFTDFLPPKACWCIWDKENTGNFADVEMAWTSFDKGAKLYRWLWNGLCRKGERAVEGKSRVHPTQKPVGLIAEILKDFTKEDDIVLDCFGGSGSTLIACEQIDRTCYMIEYEAHYVDVIIKRWETLTGEKAVLIND